jgi:AcrR family transcriptional regulator
MSIRESKKAKTREKIIEKARELFLKDGYLKTSTATIAKEVEIGEGTLFNYFPTKAELFMSVFIKNDELMAKCADEYLHDGAEVGVAISERIIDDLKSFENMDKAILREYIGVLYQLTNVEQNDAIQSVLRFDGLVLDHLREMIKVLQDRNILRQEFEINIFINCVYSVVTNLLTSYVIHTDMTFETLKLELKRHVKFILAGNH